MQNKKFIIEKFQKYQKCPALFFTQHIYRTTLRHLLRIAAPPAVQQHRREPARLRREDDQPRGREEDGLGTGEAEVQQLRRHAHRLQVRTQGCRMHSALRGGQICKLNEFPFSKTSYL